MPCYGAVLFATYPLAALATGAALHYLVERPFLRARDAARTATAMS